MRTVWWQKCKWFCDPSKYQTQWAYCKYIVSTIVQTIGDIVQTKTSGGKSADHQNTKLSGDIGGGAGEGSQIGFKIDTLSLEFHNYFRCMMMRIENRDLI